MNSRVLWLLPAALIGALLPVAGAAPATAASTLPLLTVQPADKFTLIYDDSGTGADDDVSIWRPNLASYPGFFSLGDVAMDSHGRAPANTFLVRGSGDALARPVGFRWVWDDKGSGGDQDGSLWEPVAPAGYTCLGTVATPNYSKPSTDVVRCIRSEYTVPGKPAKVWDDSGSGADHDAGLWQSDPRDHLGLPPSTFVARPSHGDPGGDARYRVLNKRLTDAPVLAGRPVDATVTRLLAPRVRLHPQERFFPSSAQFHLANVHESGGYLVTNEPLGCDDCTGPAFLDGQRPDQVPVSAYAEIVPRTEGGAPTNVTDVFYWFFYPYNQGKQVCIGLDTPAGCAGEYERFGNHVGDWEHIAIRFVDNLPARVFYSQHSGGKEFAFGDKRVNLAGWRPLVYSANGSHASYPNLGVHVYRELPNGGVLADDTAAGQLWDTAPALVPFRWQRPGSYAGSLAWLNITSRWGNPKSGCEISEPITGECVLNDGPTGPAQKGYAQPPLGPLE